MVKVYPVKFSLVHGIRRMFWSAIFTVLCLCCGCEKTIYPPNFDPQLFETVRVGDSIEDVFKRLGPPLRIYVISLNTQSNPLPEGHQYEIVPYDQALEACRQKDRCLIVNYSLQVNSRRDYYRYDLTVENGRVVSKLRDYFKE